jgi:type II secretory pathway component PulK
MTPPLVNLVAADVRRKQGFVLVAVLVVIMLASMVVISLMFHLRAEETASAAGTGSEQAWTAAMSGLYEAMRVAGQTSAGELNWQDSPEAFRGRMVLDDGSDRWHFTLYAMGDPDSEDVRFGLIDESSKLNLNTATEAMFAKLPKMTPYLVQGLLDFLDADNIPRPEGAEQEYYDALPYPYAASNARLSTLEELLLVRGFTPSVVYGEDANLNYRLDPGENDGDERFPPDNKDGKLDYGLRQYLTVSSYDVNENNARAPRIDLNDTNATFVEADFPPAVVKYIAALRRNKVQVSHPAELLEAKGKFKDENGAEVELASGVGKTELADILDRFTATKERRLPGLINVNTASAEVLQTIPEIDEALADSIVTARRGLAAEQRRTPAWLFEEALADAVLFKKIVPHLTARSFQFHCQVIGYGVPSGRFRVLEAIIDLAGSKPAIAYLRDITRLGMPFKIELTSDEETFGSFRSGNRKFGTQHRASLVQAHKSSPSRQPQRGCGPEPWVGPSSDLPWVHERDIQPQGGCGPNELAPPPDRRVATPSGLDVFSGARPSWPQRVACTTAPGEFGSGAAAAPTTPPRR